MTSQLNVDTIVDKAGTGGTNVKVANNAVAVAEGGSATTNVVQGLAKVFVSFGGTGTISSNKSLNISSLTDNGTGDYTTNISSAMDGANYIVQTSARDASGGTNLVLADPNYSRTFTASASNVWTAYAGASSKTLYDASQIEKTIHGDLA